MKIQTDKIFLTALTALAVLALAGCGQNEESDAQEHGMHGDGEHDAHTMMDGGAGGMPHGDGHDAHMGGHDESGAHMERPDDTRLVTVTATDFEFSPAEITAEPGEKLFIKLVNEGDAVHMWQLRGQPETHIHTPVGGTSGKVITAPESPGEYGIFCSTPGHEKLGMVGTLKVRGGEHGSHDH